MITDISLVTEALRERAALKPDVRRAKAALEAFERIISGCHDEDDTQVGLPIIRHARQYVDSRMRER